MAWFESEKIKIRKSHIKDLISIAKSDSEINEAEKNWLFDAVKLWGLNPKDFEDILKNLETIPFIPPKNKEERSQQVIDLVVMMMIDGKIQNVEKNLCKSLITRLGFAPSLLDTIIETIIVGFNNNIERDKVAKEIIMLQDNKSIKVDLNDQKEPLEQQADDYIKSIMDIYFDIKKRNPRFDEHSLLTSVFLILMSKNGWDMNDPDNKFIAFSETTLFSELDSPKSIRAFALYALYKGMPEVVKKFPKYGLEFQELTKNSLLAE